MYLAMVLAALAPVFVCYTARWWLGRDHLQPLWVYPVLVLAGGLGGVAFGVFGSRLLQGWFVGLSADVGEPLVLSVVVVPLAEEIGKALILLILMLTLWYRSSLDGLLFGLAAGAGFAAFENLYTFASADAWGVPGEWTTLAAVRLLPSTLIHGGTTALVGAYLGAARWERRPLVVFALPPGALLLATLIHGGWNGLMELAADEGGVAYALVGLSVLPIFALLLLFLMRAGHRLEKAEIRDELAPVVREGLLTPVDLDAVLDRRARRGRGRGRVDSRQQRAVVDLAFALRARRLDRRGELRVGLLRRLVARFHPAAGRVSLAPSVEAREPA